MMELHVTVQVGTACCQIAKHLGAVVIGTAGTEAGMQAVLQNGASIVANHREPGYTDKIKVAQKYALFYFAHISRPTVAL